MSKKLTMKEEIFCQEYVKNLGNGTKAAEKAYPGHSSDNTRAVMAHDNLRKAKVRAKIEDLKKPILERLPEIAEEVLSKIKVQFDSCKSPRDLDKLGRTLLEVAGFLGTKTPANINAIQINLPRGVESIDSLSMFELLDYKSKIDEALIRKSNAIKSINQHQKVAYDVPMLKSLTTGILDANTANSKEQSDSNS